MHLTNRFPVANSFIVPSKGKSGGLWLLWDDDINLTIIRASASFILAFVVNIVSNKAFALVCMYGDPSHHSTNVMWKDVSDFACENSGKPLFFMGDLNDIMYPCEKNDVSNVNYKRLNNFCSLIKDCGLMDLGYNGPAYTWCNKRYSSKPTYERRCLANAEWCAMYPNANIYNLPILSSDHAPILTILHSNYKKLTYHFKFENWWLSEEDFQETAIKAWSTSINQPFCVRTKHMAGSLRSWSKKKKPLQHKIRELESEIEKTQCIPPDQRNHCKEGMLVKEYEDTMSKLTKFISRELKSIGLSRVIETLVFSIMLLLKGEEKTGYRPSSPQKEFGLLILK